MLLSFKEMSRKLVWFMSIVRSGILLLIFSFINGIRLKSTRIWHFILSDNKRHLISSVNKAVRMIWLLVVLIVAIN